MNLDELAKEYHLLKDKEDRYYKMKNGKRVEPFATIIVAGEILEISSITIKKYIKRKHLLLQKIKFNNKLQKGYNLNSIISACSYLLGSIPIANKKGIAIIDGQKFAALATLRGLLGLSVVAIYSRVKKFETKKFKLKSGQIADGYNINEAKKACSDLLRELPLANKKGIAIINSQKFTTPYILTKLLKLSHNAINPRIKKAGLKTRKIKVRDGNIRLAYNIAKVKKACADLLLKKIHPANKSNIAIIGKKKFTTIENLIRILGLSNAPIQRRITIHKIQSQKIKIGGRIFDGYSISEVEKACADLLQNFPRANKKGIAVIKGREFTTLERLYKIFSISPQIIAKRIEENNIPSQKIKTIDGNIRDSYNIEKVKKNLTDLLQNFPRANKKGIALIKGYKYSTPANLARIFKSNNTTIQSRIKKHKLTPQKIKLRDGRIVNAYRIDDARKICASIIKKFPSVNSFNIAIISGKKYATLHTLSEILNVNPKELTFRIKQLRMFTKQIKLMNGNVENGYNIEKVRKACNDMPKRISRKNQPVSK